MKNFNEKDYNSVLTETSNYFAAQGVNIMGEGYKEIASNTALFESYVEQLTEGCNNADDAANMAQLMVNTNTTILKESSLTGIQPIASLSMPVIRKLWPKFALKDAIKTEVAKTPRFVVTYTQPYMFKGDNQKVYLPRGLKDSYNDLTAAGKKEFTAEKNVALAAGAANVISFDDDAHVTIANTPSAAKKQPLDELIVRAYAATAVDTAAQVTITDATAGEYLVSGVTRTLATGDTIAKDAVAYKLGAAVKINKRLGVYGNAVYPFGTDGQLMVQFDGKNAKATFAAIGASVVVFAKAGVSSEYNEESWSIGFDINRQDIDIPSGQHINAPLPIEALNDMMALYQIDGTKETVDLMTNVFAMKLDLEVLDFLRDSFLNQPGNEAYDGTKDGYAYPSADNYAVKFDCKPAAGFAGSPKAWREEIKPLIDHLAQRIKNQTYLQTGVFTIIANPLDVQVLANVDWQFRGGQGGNMDGVDVDYSIGTYVGANAYKVIASTNVPAGAMYLVFTPSSDTQMTYKYYPYTFSTEMGYVDPNRSRTPSIMMTKRHQFSEFLPAIGCIIIENNDGNWFNQYVSTLEWTE